MKRIAIDPNIRTVNNETRTGFENYFGEVDELDVDTPVLAMGDETDIVFDAKVTHISYLSRLIYLAVDWQSAREDS